MTAATSCASFHLKQADSHWRCELLIEDSWPRLLADCAVGLLQSGRIAVSAVASHLLEALERYERKTVTNAIGVEKASFLQDAFTDGYSQDNTEYRPPVTSDANALDLQKPEPLLVMAWFYQGIYLFLRREERYVSWDARLTLLFAAWQWYNALKRATALLGTEQSRAIIYELAMAYRELVSLLDDDHLATALGKLARSCEVPSSNVALMRQRLRLSLVLQDPETREANSFSSPLRAAGCWGGPLHWNQVTLHPVFEKESGARAAVRRLARDWLLPRYDYTGALHLARLLGGWWQATWSDKHGQCKGKHLFPSTFALLVGGPLFILLVVMLTILHPLVLLVPGYVAIIEWVFLMFLLVTYLSWFDFRLLVHLLLPRLLGGVLIGYFAVMLQPTHLTNLIWQDNALGLWQPGIPALLLGLGVLVVAALYFFFDALPMVEDRWAAVWRSGLVLAFAIVATISLGLLVVPLAQLPCVQADWRLIGPLGMIDWHNLAALAPIALLGGIVTQLLWQRETVTTPVWAPVQHQ